MDPAPFLKAANDMGVRFLDLLDTLSAVAAVTAMDMRHKDVNSLLAEALDILVQHQDLARSSIFLVDADTLVFAAGTDFARTQVLVAGDLGQQRLPEYGAAVCVGEGLLGIAASTRESQYEPECSIARMLGVKETPATAARGSVLCVPIITGDTVFGVTTVFHPEKDHFQHGHRHALALFCGVVAHMLASHQVMRRMEQAVEHRTSQLARALEDAEELRRRYQELSTVDELTALHNRRFFFPEAEAAVARAVRHRQALCLLVLDLDHFKRINDSFGHAAGDEVLRDVAGVLRQHTREGDILARTGGEEFVVALPHTSASGAHCLAERIRSHIEDLAWAHLSQSLQATASIGVACLDLAGEGNARQHLERLMRHGDQAMYCCKRDGRNRVALY